MIHLVTTRHLILSLHTGRVWVRAKPDPLVVGILWADQAFLRAARIARTLGLPAIAHEWADLVEFEYQHATGEYR